MAARPQHATPQSARARRIIELGRQAPIEIGAARLGTRERRRLSLRWLAGTALTGCCGMALIGSALYLGLGSQSNFALPPEYVEAAGEPEQGEAVSAGKGDRLVRPVDIVAAKQSFHAQTTIRVGEKDVVKSRAFTRVATTLTTTPTGYADAVPPFNPLKLASTPAGQPEPPPDPGPVQDEAEVAFSTHDLKPADASAVAGELTPAEAEAQAAELLRANAGAKTPPLPPQMLLMRTSQAGLADPLGGLAYATTGAINPNAPFASIEVRMVPENVTNAAKSSKPEEQAPDEALVQLKHGESFEDMLRAKGASKEAIAAMLAAFGVRPGDSPVAEGQRLILQFDAAATPGAARPIARVSIYADEQLKSAIALNDAGSYVRVSQRPAPTRKGAGGEGGNAGGMELYQSLFETALKQGVPKPVVQEMVSAFANDVDFQRPTAGGDSVEAFYSEPDEIDPHPQLLYATVTLRDQSLKFYRFQTPDDGVVDYYDENGRSTRKFLIRKPIVAGDLRSTFGMRFHPILHYMRMHNGVDWTAPIGTPILAAGGGTVLKAEFSQGYGRRVEIQHINGYVTTYNHMSGFGPGMAAGVHVNQGQVVGYLGQSGLATGPHLHYEVIINGNYVDPLAIKLARTREFDGKLLGAFKRERERIDALIAQAPNAPIVTAQKAN